MIFRWSPQVVDDPGKIDDQMNKAMIGIFFLNNKVTWHDTPFEYLKYIQLVTRGPACWFDGSGSWKKTDKEFVGEKFLRLWKTFVFQHLANGRGQSIYFGTVPWTRNKPNRNWYHMVYTIHFLTEWTKTNFPKSSTTKTNAKSGVSYIGHQENSSRRTVEHFLNERNSKALVCE